MPLRTMSLSTMILSLSVLAIPGCKIGNADSPYRHREPGVRRLEETTSAGGLFALEPDDGPRIDCSHCGYSNRLGRTTCRKCGQRLSSLPVEEPCAACEGMGKLPDGAVCPTCQGKGWVKKDPAEPGPPEER